MPLPMVHLAVGIEVNQSKDTPLHPDFLLGCLAPDAIHMRPDIEPGDKAKTHLRDDPSCPPLARIRDLVTGCRAPFALAEGYVVHLLTDYFWQQSVWEEFVKLAPQGLTRQELRRLYYQETDQIDMQLYRKMQWRSAVWDLLRQAEARSVPGLLTAEEIDRWLKRVLGWYTPEHEPMIEPKYITYERVIQFIRTASERIRQVLDAWESKSNGEETQ